MERLKTSTIIGWVRDALGRNTTRGRSALDGRARTAHGEAKIRASRLRRLGVVAYKDGDYPSAVDWLEQSIREVGDEHWAWLWLARARWRLGDLAAAQKAAERAMKLKPGWRSAAELLVTIHSATGDSAAVGVLYQIALADGDNVALLDRVLRQLLRLEAQAEAREVAETILTLDPSHVRASRVTAGTFAQRGRIAFRAGQYEQAADWFDRSLQLVGDKPSNWLALARAKRYAGDLPGARDAVAQALTLRPEWDEATAFQAHLAIPEPVFATTVLANAELQPVTDDGALYLQRGRAAFERQEYQRAEEWFQRALDADQGNAWTWLWLTRTRLRRGEVGEASAAAERAVALRPRWRPAQEALASAYRAEGRDADAVAVLRDMAATHLDDSETLKRALRELSALHAHIEVDWVIDALLKLDPASEEATAARVQSLVQRGDVSGSEEFLADALRRFSSPKASRLLVHHFRLRGDWLRAWRAIAEGDASAIDLTSLREIARGLTQIGEVSAASQAFAAASARKPADDALRRRSEIAASDARVLRGEWRPPELTTVTVEPIPGRVLHVVGKSLPYSQAGYTIRTQSIAKAQQAAGLDPQVVSQYGFPWTTGVEAALTEEIEGIPYHRLPPTNGIVETSESQLTEHVRQLVYLASSVRPAVLHAASDYRNALVALAAGEMLDIPVVYEVRGLWEESWLSNHDAGTIDSEFYTLRRDREIDAMRRAARIVTLSTGMRDELTARDIDVGKIQIVPNAVDVELFVPPERNRDLGDRLGFAMHDVVLGYVSTFTAYEGISYLIDAIALLSEAGCPVRGLLVGDGSELPGLKRQTERLGLSDLIVFTGRVPHAEVLDYYGLIDVFVVPRTADRVSQLVTPLKPYEAMATGRAVVVSGVNALREMVIPGQTGLVFEPENAADLARVVRPLIDDREGRAALGRAARAWVCANRTWVQNAQRYLELYREMGIPLPPGTI